MNTTSSNRPMEPGWVSSATRSSYGSLPIQESEKDEVYQQIVSRQKEFVTAVPPANILQGLDYLKIELLVPGISKEDCTLGSLGLLLWIKIHKVNRPAKTDDTFHWSFIIPENLILSKGTAYYGPDGKLVIFIPKDKHALGWVE